MPNTDNPHGLRPLMRNLGGGCPHVQYFKKVVGYGTAIFVNDAVHRVADGSIEPGASATPGTTLWSGVNVVHGAASKATDHIVIVSPLAVFEAQDNDDTDGFAEADMGLNVNIEANAGSATTLQSGHELDESTAATTSTLDLHMLDKLNVEGNAFGEFCRVEVVFNKHRMAHSAAGV